MVKMKKNDLFMTNYTKIITQFLYKQFVRKILYILMPTYIVHQMSITIYLQIVEKLRLTLFARLNEHDPQIKNIKDFTASVSEI